MNTLHNSFDRIGTAKPNFYDLEEFRKDCYIFNQVAGKDKAVMQKDIINQAKIILEEANETLADAEANDDVGVLDGLCDVLVTAFGLMQKLENAGFNTREAMKRVAENNASKYPRDEDIVLATIINDNGANGLRYEYNENFGVYVIKDRNDKIRKPVGFESVDISDCVPPGFKHGFTTGN